MRIMKQSACAESDSMSDERERAYRHLRTNAERLLRYLTPLRHGDFKAPGRLVKGLARALDKADVLERKQVDGNDQEGE